LERIQKHRPSFTRYNDPHNHNCSGYKGIIVLDAYTLRKTLPRIIIVAIAITISWPLLEFLVQLSNFLGDSLRNIMLQPFNSLPRGMVGEGFSSAVVALGGAVIFSTGGLGALTFILTALISLLVAFFTLVIRQILIVLLVVISPLAIVAYLLPNTERFFKMWRKTLTSVLVVFPIITLFLTAGQIFSNIAFSSNNGHPSDINQIVGIVAYFIPYLLLPTAFKLAGDVMGAIHGATHNKTGGMRKSLEGYRAKERQKNMLKLKNGERLGGRVGQTKYGKKFNKLTSGLATGTRGHFGMGARGNAAMADESAVAAAEILKDPRFQQLGLNDNGVGLLALSGGSERRARDVAKQLGLSDDETEKAINAIKASGGFSAVRSQAAMSLFAQNKARLKGFQDHANPYSLVEQAAEEASFGNQERKEAMLNNFSFVARQSGIPFVSSDVSSVEGALDSYKKLDVQQVSAMQPKSVQRYIKNFEDIINNPSSNREQVVSASKALREISTIHSGNPESKQHVSDFMDRMGVKTVLGTQTPTGLTNPDGSPLMRKINGLDDELVKIIQTRDPGYTVEDLRKDSRATMGGVIS